MHEDTCLWGWGGLFIDFYMEDANLLPSRGNGVVDNCAGIIGIKVALSLGMLANYYYLLKQPSGL